MATDHGKWKFNHTMLRVKDPQRSLEYYKFLGLSQINKMSNPDNKFDLYFLGMWFRGLEEVALGTSELSNPHACNFLLGI
jgi:catechol 2,3-dioxygenase-like lactoylglutathione lyase family enzyme